MTDIINKGLQINDKEYAMIGEEKKRFVITIEPEVFNKFRELALNENRSASNLAVKLIKDYIKANSD